MISKPRLVLDTNIIISRLLMAGSTPANAAHKAFQEGEVIASDETLTELVDVLARPKFDRYISIEDRKRFIRLYLQITTKIPCLKSIQASRDPKDDKFLELAVNGNAAFIISGDKDLLDLHPFQGTRILTPSAFLDTKVNR